MRFGGFITVFTITLAAGLTGCTGEHARNYSLQNQWLANNYPDRLFHLNQIDTAQPYFREDVIAGQIQLGMTIDEVLIATDTTPFGPKRYRGKFWCDKQPVGRCENDCQNCEGILFLGNDLAWFSGHTQPPTVVNIASETSNDSIFATAPTDQSLIAEALYRDQIINGMSLYQVDLVLATTAAHAAYFCDESESPTTSNCTASCHFCKIVIYPRTPGDLTKAIFLQTVAGEQRVIRIETY
ncbi:MAG: hypothetical protein AMJ53_06400 [Gammaproteobacteria bacterium SG8_11]|nr:MAG: hypothetical protein AMJ53_06400 [Gammaproteobacteria bacterium SG8_11]